jgi:regulator of RNase E activity RraA
MPGDIIVGDQESVAVVPRNHATDVLTRVSALMARERARIAEIKSGVLYKAEIDEALRQKGVIE